MTSSSATGGRMRQALVGLCSLALLGAVGYFGGLLLERRWIDDFKALDRELDCCLEPARPRCAEAGRKLEGASHGFGDPAYVARSILLECAQARERARQVQDEQRMQQEAHAQPAGESRGGGPADTGQTHTGPADTPLPGGAPGHDGGGVIAGAQPYVSPDAVTVPPPPPMPDLGALPRNDAGLPVLVMVPGVELAIDTSQHDAMNALTTCTALISRCVGPGRTLDACVESAPSCATARPWEERAVCCPRACRDGYEKARRAGRSSRDAFNDVYFDHPDCFPGVLDLLGGRP